MTMNFIPSTNNPALNVMGWLFFPISSQQRLIFILSSSFDRGAFSIVRHAISKKDGTQYAIKIVNKKSVREINQVQNEIAILSQSDHPNIIKLYDVYETEESLFLVMEL